MAIALELTFQVVYGHTPDEPLCCLLTISGGTSMAHVSRLSRDAIAAVHVALPCLSPYIAFEIAYLALPSALLLAGPPRPMSLPARRLQGPFGLRLGRGVLRGVRGRTPTHCARCRRGPALPRHRPAPRHVPPCRRPGQSLAPGCTPGALAAAARALPVRRPRASSLAYRSWACRAPCMPLSPCTGWARWRSTRRSSAGGTGAGTCRGRRWRTWIRHSRRCRRCSTSSQSSSGEGPGRWQVTACGCTSK